MQNQLFTSKHSWNQRNHQGNEINKILWYLKFTHNLLPLCWGICLFPAITSCKPENELQNLKSIHNIIQLLLVNYDCGNSTSLYIKNSSTVSQLSIQSLVASLEHIHHDIITNDVFATYRCIGSLFYLYRFELIRLEVKKLSCSRPSTTILYVMFIHMRTAWKFNTNLTPIGDTAHVNSLKKICTKYNIHILHGRGGGVEILHCLV